MHPKRIPEEAWPKHKGVFDGQAGATLTWMTHANDPALEWMDVLKSHSRGESHEKFDQALHRYTGRGSTSQERPHMLRRIVESPCFLIDILPFFAAHSRMVGANMLD